MSHAGTGETLCFIGAGNIATALVRGFLSAGLVPASAVRAACPSAGRAGSSSSALAALGVSVHADNAAAAAGASIVFFAVKPHLLEAAVVSCRGALGEGAVVVSLASGVGSGTLQRWLGPYRLRPIVRVMPNTPTGVGQGAAGMAPGENGLAGEAELARVARLFAAVGVVHAVKEAQLDAVTGLSGSGPAFICILIEALADGGVAAGLPRAVALSLATQLVKGTATMVQETGLHPGVLKDAVASPGGTTIAGLHALETAGFRGALMSAVIAAARRATELANQPTAAPQQQPPQ